MFGTSLLCKWKCNFWLWLSWVERKLCSISEHVGHAMTTKFLHRIILKTPHAQMCILLLTPMLWIFALITRTEELINMAFIVRIIPSNRDNADRDTSDNKCLWLSIIQHIVHAMLMLMKSVFSMPLIDPTEDTSLYCWVKWPRSLEYWCRKCQLRR